MQTLFHNEAKSKHLKLLNDAQEEMPPTSQIFKNLVVELVRSPVGKNWIRRFYQQYVDRFACIHLRGIDQKLKIADNSVYLQHIYQIVWILSLFMISNSLRDWSLKVGRKDWKVSYIHILWWKSIRYRDLLYGEKNCRNSPTMYRKAYQPTSAPAYG